MIKFCQKKFKEFFFQRLLGLILILLFGHIEPIIAADDSPLDIFSHQYYEKNQSLSQQTDADDFSFLSHQWLATYISNVYKKLTIMASFQQQLPESMFGDTMKIEIEPLSDVRSLTSSVKTTEYPSFLRIENIHDIRKFYSLIHTREPIDKILNIFIRQERFLESQSKGGIKTLYEKKYKTSFYNIKKVLFLLRNDMEITEWISEVKTREKEDIIKPYLGRLFFIEKKGPNRVVRYTASGTVVEVHGKKIILSCRHFNPVDVDRELEIYFIPSHELSPIDYLPGHRIEKEDSCVDWDQYHKYLVNGIFLLNTHEMVSTLSFQDHKRELSSNQGIRLEGDDIKSLKKLDDHNDNYDVAFMTIHDPQILGPSCKIEINPKIELNSPDVWAAGYPGGGLADYSLAIVGLSQSDFYKDIIFYHDNRLGNPHWHYKISSFPASHGMSGGPVFTVKGNVPHISSILTGVDYQCLGALCSVIQQEHIDFLKHKY